VKAVHTVVVARTGPNPGQQQGALALVCECGGHAFLIFALDDFPEHLHFQCSQCATTYCDQACSAV
jgi:hypothetical protein